MMICVIAALLFHFGPATDTPAAKDVTRVVTSIATSSAQPSAAAGASASLSMGATNGSNVSLAETTATQPFSTLRLPDPAPARPVRVIAAETTPPRKAWLLLSFAQHGAAAFDAYSTRQAISGGAHEDDPLLRPFAHSSAIYLVSQISPAILDYAARRMQRSQLTVLRRSWWLPQSASTALSVAAGTHNLAISKHNIH